MRRWWPIAASMLGALLSVSLLSAAPALVADLDREPGDPSLATFPSGGLELGGALYFESSDPQHGVELWRTDGSAAGTVRLTDLCPGPCPSSPGGFFAFDGRIYFFATDDERGSALWRTDGTPGGEERVGGVCLTECGAALRGLALWQGEIWILTQRAGEAPLLFRGAGEPGSFHLAADLCADLGLCGFAPYGAAYLTTLSATADSMLLSVERGSAGELFRTDVTRQGTVLVHRFGQSATAQAAFARWRAPRAARPARSGRAQAVSGQAESAAPIDYFVDGASVDTVSLWRTDYTPQGTYPVVSVAGWFVEPNIAASVVVDGVFYAVFSFGELLRSDGTAAGTALFGRVSGEFAPRVLEFHGAVYIVATDGLWQTDGTTMGTRRIAPFSGADILSVLVQSERLFILTYSSGGQLTTSDGTAAGTRRVDLGKGPPIDQYAIGPFAGGVLVSRGGDGLWSVDSTGTRVALVHDFRPASAGGAPYSQTALGDRLLFFGRTGAKALSLFSSDGTAAGTARVTRRADQPFYPSYGPKPSDFAALGIKRFFSANARFFVTDGTDAGTQTLNGRNRPPQFFTPVGEAGGKLVFDGHESGYVRCDPGDDEPWVTDGLRRHTRKLVELNPYQAPGSGSSQCETVALASAPGPGVGLGGEVVFPADDLVHGRELFATDGTAAGTRLVADVNPATVANDVTDPTSEPRGPDRIGVSSSPTELVAAGGRVFFAADDGAGGRELWVTNGRRRGTRRVVDLRPGARGSSPHALVAFRGGVAFFADAGEGEALFTSDGTAAGTVRASDLVLAGARSQASALTVAGNRLFFVAFNESIGTELWTSAGTAASTHPVADLRPGPRGSSPQKLVAVGSRVVFAADDGLDGLEPWTSDGTAVGTRRVGDIAPGSAASGPGPFTVVGGRLLFGADDGSHGRELWQMPLSDLSTADQRPR